MTKEELEKMTTDGLAAKVLELNTALDECGHTLFHILECKETKLCGECERMVKHAIKLTGWKAPLK